jgi:hypothetical protein
VKYTTARRVAEKSLRMIARGSGHHLKGMREVVRPDPIPLWPREELEEQLRTNPQAARARILRLIEQEAILHLDDLFLRRTDWGMDPAEAVRLAEQVCEVLGWPQQRRDQELERLQRDCARSLD